jgi:hypothetical protein
MNKSELRTAVRNLLLVKFDNVEEIMFHPDEYAQLAGNFPYVTMVFNQWTPQGNSRYGTQSMDIIGICTGDKSTLMERLDKMENDLIDAIQKTDPKININSIDNNNLFAPFGLNSGVYYPYAGIRVNCIVPNVKNA